MSQILAFETRLWTSVLYTSWFCQSRERRPQSVIEQIVVTWVAWSSLHPSRESYLQSPLGLATTPPSGSSIWVWIKPLGCLTQVWWGIQYYKLMHLRGWGCSWRFLGTGEPWSPRSYWGKLWEEADVANFQEHQEKPSSSNFMCSVILSVYFVGVCHMCAVCVYVYVGMCIYIHGGMY